jgi:hypothetical protein
MSLSFANSHVLNILVKDGLDQQIVVSTALADNNLIK